MNMWNRSHLHNGNRYSLLFWQFLIVALCAAYIVYSYAIHMLPDRRAREEFRPVSCLVMSKRVNETGRFFTTYRADFLISYNVNRIQYSRWVAGNGLDESHFPDRKAQERILNQFDVGSSYTCYYDPNNPQTSLLMFRHTWTSMYPLAIPIIIGLITLYFLILNLIVISQRRE